MPKSAAALAAGQSGNRRPQGRCGTASRRFGRRFSRTARTSARHGTGRLVISMNRRPPARPMMKSRRGRPAASANCPCRPDRLAWLVMQTRRLRQPRVSAEMSPAGADDFLAILEDIRAMKPTTLLTSSGSRRGRRRGGASRYADRLQMGTPTAPSLPGIEIHHIVKRLPRRNDCPASRLPSGSQDDAKTFIWRPRSRQSTGTPDRPAKPWSISPSVVVTCASTLSVENLQPRISRRARRTSPPSAAIVAGGIDADAGVPDPT